MKNLVKISTTNCQMLSMLINDLLDYSKFDKKQSIILKPSYFPLREVIEEIRDLVIF